MEERTYDPGDVILREGDASDVVYRILSGEVEVFAEYDGQRVVFGTVKAGEFLGEMGVIEEQPRSASASARNHVTAEALDRGEFFQLMREDGSLAYRLIIRLCERLRRASRRLAEATVSREIKERLEITAPISDPQPILAQPGLKGAPDDLHLTLLPASQGLGSHMPEQGIPVSKFPFCVGRLPVGNEPEPHVPMDLILPDSPPFRLSRQHFSIYRHSKGYGIFDLGSTLGTEVNGEFLGDPFGKDFEYLNLGENRIIAGGAGSPFAFKVLLEEAKGDEAGALGSTEGESDGREEDHGGDGQSEKRGKQRHSGQTGGRGCRSERGGCRACLSP